MTGAWARYEGPALPPILHAALGCFVENGYHGTTTRNLAAAAGLSVPGLYHHYVSKQVILVEIMARAMGDLHARSVAALAEAGDAIEERLRLHIECLVLFHAHRADLAFVAASEIRSLEPPARTTHIARRDRQQRILDGIVEDGAAAGLFRVEEPRGASRAIVTMCTGVAQWYRVGGGLSPTELADRYVLLSRRALGQPV